MDWISVFAGMDLGDRDFPARAARIQAFSRVLAGTQYDHIANDFATEQSSGGQYVPLRNRRPSSRSNLCRTVVDDAVSLLFSEGHFPAVVTPDETTREALTALIRERTLNQVMLDAATTCSVGSVAILLRVLGNRPFFDVLPTAFLTPVWQPDAPDVLAQVTERYKVNAADLQRLGYPGIDPAAGKYWFQKIWDDTVEAWFVPWPVRDALHVPQLDTSRTVTHALGFVPMVWIRNLPGGDATDGDCTFVRGIDTVIEMDYLLSQGGRGLRYASDPTLLIKTDNPDGTARTGGAANALFVEPTGDARMLEIAGSAAAAVLEHVRELRAAALEMMHGSRAHADKVSAAQSGRAQEMMNQGLIWLADRLRSSYGEVALVALLRMVCAAAARVSGGLLLDGKPHDKLAGGEISLSWPPWYQPTATDKQAEAAALSVALGAGILSRRSAIGVMCATYSINDVDAEDLLIKADLAEQLARELAVKAAVQVKENAAA